MLHSYPAELHDSQLIWIDRKPAHAHKQRVLVVMEDESLDSQSPHAAETSAADRQRVFAAAKGCLGTAGREQVLQQLAQLRQDWDHSPLTGRSGH
jgi:hypothetical protein